MLYVRGRLPGCEGSSALLEVDDSAKIVHVSYDTGICRAGGLLF